MMDSISQSDQESEAETGFDGGEPWAIGPEFQAPLDLLTSISTRLLRGEIPTNQARLESLFQHLHSLVGEVVEASFAQLSSGLEELEEAHLALCDEAESESDSEESLIAFEEARELVDEALVAMHESFFSAQTLEQLEGLEGALRAAEVQLAEGLSRMEAALTLVELPELKVHEEASSEFVGEAAEALATCLESLSAHLEDGRTGHLEFALERLEQARSCLVRALSTSKSEGTSESTDDSGLNSEKQNPTSPDSPETPPEEVG